MGEVGKIIEPNITSFLSQINKHFGRSLFSSIDQLIEGYFMDSQEICKVFQLSKLPLAFLPFQVILGEQISTGKWHVSRIANNLCLVNIT